MESKRSFTSNIGHMSLWEVAHRWNNLDSRNTFFRIPISVQDTLHTLMWAQIESQLMAGDTTGYMMRNASWYGHWKNYVPSEEQNWDGSENHRHMLHAQASESIARPHYKLIQLHEEMVRSKKFKSKYLKSITVDRHDLACWATEYEMPFPDFWYSAPEKSEFFKEWSNDGHENKPGYNKSREETSDEWRSWRAERRSRILCRELFDYFRELAPERSSDSIFRDDLMINFAFREYAPKNINTFYDWISGLDRRSPENKRGPKKKV